MQLASYSSWQTLTTAKPQTAPPFPKTEPTHRKTFQAQGLGIQVFQTPAASRRMYEHDNEKNRSLRKQHAFVGFVPLQSSKPFAMIRIWECAHSDNVNS